MESSIIIQNSIEAHGGLWAIYGAHVTTHCFSVFIEVVKKQGKFSVRKPMVRICTFLHNLIIKPFTLKACFTTSTSYIVGSDKEDVRIF